MNCPLCTSATSSIPSFTFAAYQIYTCEQCAARFTQPFVDNAPCFDQKSITKKKTYLNTVSLSAGVYDKLRPLWDIQNKRILDIGCGTGTFLETVRKDNEVFGIEISEAYRDILKSKGIPHVIGDLHETLGNFPDEHFDLITMWDVFEHLQDPNRVLRAIKPKLSPQGKLIIWTNNYDDCISFAAASVYHLSLGFSKSLMATSFNRAGGHNYNFVARSLEPVWRKHGLSVVDAAATDTPSEKLSDNILFRSLLNIFYAMNRLLRKGKIIYYVLKKEGG
jgi:2-polyprenyl-3-methyl-5-hydroxy-6-metoxy-1,4-benzoquinol methylase